MAKILCVSADGGAANALNCVGDSLTEQGHYVSHVVQKGLKAENKPLFNKTVIEDCREDIEKVLNALRPNIIVAGVSGEQEDITLSLARIATGFHIPIVKVIDFWGTGMPHKEGFAVTRACVLDEQSRTYEADRRGMPLEHIIATGAP